MGFEESVNNMSPSVERVSITLELPLIVSPYLSASKQARYSLCNRGNMCFCTIFLISSPTELSGRLHIISSNAV